MGEQKKANLRRLLPGYLKYEIFVVTERLFDEKEPQSHIDV